MITNLYFELLLLRNGEKPKPASSMKRKSFFMCVID